MTVETQTKKVTVLGNDAAFVFSFSPIVIFASTDLEVTHVDANGAETLLTEGSGSSNYSVTVALYPGTGSITYPADSGTPLPTGESLVIRRVLTLEQTINLENQDGYDPEVLESGLDRLVMVDLQQQEELDRALKMQVSSSADLTVPPAEADKFIGWNTSGDALENKTPNSNTFITVPVSSTDNAVARFDGTSGEAFQNSSVTIDDTGAVTFGNVTQTRTNLGLTNSAILLHKLDAAAAPTTGDDSGDGYSAGSVWVDLTSDIAYVCVDASVGAAVWEPINPMTTNGDLIVQIAGLAARLAVGDAGKVLGVSAGLPAWIHGGWEHIDTQTASASATIDFESLDGTYQQYRCRLLGVRPTTDAVSISVRVGTGATPTYQSGASAYQYAGIVITNTGGVQGLASTGISHIPVLGQGQAAGGATTESGDVWVHFGLVDNASLHQKFQIDASYIDSDPEAVRYIATGFYAAATPITAIRFLATGGSTLAEGTFILEGRRAS